MIFYNNIITIIIISKTYKYYKQFANFIFKKILDIHYNIYLSNENFIGISHITFKRLFKKIKNSPFIKKFNRNFWKYCNIF